MDHRIREKIEYIVYLDDMGKIAFDCLLEAKAFLAVYDKLDMFYKWHAKDIKKLDADHANCKFSWEDEEDSTDIVTVESCYFAPLQVQVFEERRADMMRALSSIDDVRILGKYKVVFECHCPSER